jgi:hypothetical protein
MLPSSQEAFSPRGPRREFAAIAPEINVVSPLIAAGACRPDAHVSILQALSLIAIIDTIGLKIGPVRIAQI